jgi:hypothetical protein
MPAMLIDMDQRRAQLLKHLDGEQASTSNGVWPVQLCRRRPFIELVQLFAWAAIHRYANPTRNSVVPVHAVAKETRDTQWRRYTSQAIEQTNL